MEECTVKLIQVHRMYKEDGGTRVDCLWGKTRGVAEGAEAGREPDYQLAVALASWLHTRFWLQLGQRRWIVCSL